MKITVYCDGSSRGNPGPGGYGIVMFRDDSMEILYAESTKCEDVTNNQMELAALLRTLDYIEDNYPDDSVTIITDSSYVCKSWNEWMENWARNGWINSKKQVVENLGYMKQLWEYRRRDFFHCSVEHCHGHVGIEGNEYADMLARGQVKRFYDTAIEDGYRLVDYSFNHSSDIVDYI